MYSLSTYIDIYREGLIVGFFISSQTIYVNTLGTIWDLPGKLLLLSGDVVVDDLLL